MSPAWTFTDSASLKHASSPDTDRLSTEVEPFARALALQRAGCHSPARISIPAALTVWSGGGGTASGGLVDAQRDEPPVLPAARPEGKVKESDSRQRDMPISAPQARDFPACEVPLSFDPTTRKSVNAVDADGPAIQIGAAPA